MPPNLVGQVCLVTGGSNGIGRGIALQLGGAGAKVYVTGRNKAALESCCGEIDKRGGQGVPLLVDHSKDDEVKQLFERIQDEEKGKLDVLVNNAYSGVNMIMENLGKKFWEVSPTETWDMINDVGLRNHYICTTYAARLMIPRKSGLICIVSSAGGLNYAFNVAYGVGKAACDRIATDCAFELQGSGVSVVSLWPGPVKTDTIMKKLANNEQASEEIRGTLQFAESLEFTGKAVAHLAADPDIRKKAGRILMTADLAREYGFTDDDGRINGDFRRVKALLQLTGWNNLARFVPDFLHLPRPFLYYSGYKF